MGAILPLYCYYIGTIGTIVCYHVYRQVMYSMGAISPRFFYNIGTISTIVYYNEDRQVYNRYGQYGSDIATILLRYRHYTTIMNTEKVWALWERYCHDIATIVTIVPIVPIWLRYRDDIAHIVYIHYLGTIGTIVTNGHYS